MKWNYFLRGLGTGIILSTLILCVSYRSSQSDRSVVDQAKELGMIFPEGTQPPETVPSISPSMEPEPTASVMTDHTGSGAGVTGVVSPEPAMTPQPSGTPVPTKVPQPTPTQKPKTTRKPKATKKPAATQKPKATKKPAATKKPVSTVSTIEFKVRGGLLSSTVAREMKEAGVISDDKKFDEYLEKNGYAKKIRQGIYKIPKGASYSQIARIITRS